MEHLTNVLLWSLVTQSLGICYFPAVYQGEYVSQAVIPSQDAASVASPGITYSTISVLYDSIPVWGYCHKRIGSNVILMDDTGGLTCYRCFQLSLRSSSHWPRHWYSLSSNTSVLLKQLKMV